MPISQGAGAVPRPIFSHSTISRSRLHKFTQVQEVMEERKVMVKPNHNSNLHHPPSPQNKKNSMKIQTITTTMRIIEVTIEAADPTGVNIVVESHIEGLSKGEGDKKIITEANTKATVDNLIPPVVAIIIIIMAITEAEVAVAMVVTIIDHTVMVEAVTEAITIINTINITCMMMDPSSNNMVHHVLFVEVSIILLNIVLRENMTLIILWRK